MFNVGGPEIVVIILVALVVLGPEQLPKALRTFETLNRVNLYALAYRTNALKTAAGREKRIRDFVDKLKRGETPHPNGASLASSKNAARPRAQARKPVSTKRPKK